MAFDIVNAHFRDVATIMRGMTIGMRLLESGAISLEPLVTHRFDAGRHRRGVRDRRGQARRLRQGNRHLLTPPTPPADADAPADVARMATRHACPVTISATWARDRREGQALSLTISGQGSTTVRPLPCTRPDIRLSSSSPAAAPVS